MVTYKNAAAYRKSVSTRIKNAIKVSRNNGARSSFYFANLLRTTAPIKSGRLISSIRRRPVKNGYSVIAGYTIDGVNIGKWVNQEFDITPEVPGGRASRFLKTDVGNSVRYGQPGAAHWTAKEYPWFDENKQKTIDRYRVSYKKIRAVLRG